MEMKMIRWCCRGTGAADRKQPPHPHYGSPPPRGSKNRYLGEFSRPVLISSGTCTCSSANGPATPAFPILTTLGHENYSLQKKRNMASRIREYWVLRESLFQYKIRMRRRWNRSWNKRWLYDWVDKTVSPLHSLQIQQSPVQLPLWQTWKPGNL